MPLIVSVLVWLLLQVPDASGDLLAAAVLDQQPSEQLSQQAREALAALPELFPVTVSKYVPLLVILYHWQTAGMFFACRRAFTAPQCLCVLQISRPGTHSA